MNKKMKIFLALTLIIQLLIPSYLLYHHYTVMDTALNSAEEYRFRINHFDFEIPANADADYECESIYFTVEEIEGNYNNKIAVSVAENGSIIVSELENTAQTDSWFDYDYYRQYRRLNRDDFVFPENISERYVINEIRKEYAWYNRNDADRKYAYVAAKIHKGVFIPTAIYFEGLKVITIIND